MCLNAFRRHKIKADDAKTYSSSTDISVLEARYAVIIIFNHNFTELILLIGIFNWIYECIAYRQVRVFPAKRINVIYE